MNHIVVGHRLYRTMSACEHPIGRSLYYLTRTETNVYKNDIRLISKKTTEARV